MASGTGSKPIVLHIGDPVRWNTELYAQFSKDFTVVRPSFEERQREEFIKGLKENRWGNFAAIFRPFWNTGGEMGRWDKELIPLVPQSCKIFASAGAGFDWADVDILAQRGTSASKLESPIANRFFRNCLLQQVPHPLYLLTRSDKSNQFQCSGLFRICRRFCNFPHPRSFP